MGSIGSYSTSGRKKKGKDGVKTYPVLSFFPPDVLCGPSDLTWREGTPILGDDWLQSLHQWTPS
jgi:hypothetical protein